MARMLARRAKEMARAYARRTLNGWYEYMFSGVVVVTLVMVGGLILISVKDL